MEENIIWTNTVQVGNEVDLQAAIFTAASSKEPTIIELLNNIDLTQSLLVYSGVTIRLTSYESNNYEINAGEQNFRAITAVTSVGNNTTLYLGNITITGGKTTSMGGGIYGDSSGGYFILVLEDGSLITNNSAASGGGIYFYNGHITMLGGEISYNTASNLGGAILLGNGDVATNEVFNMQGGIIQENTAATSGGIHEGNKWTVNISGGQFINNHATNYAGAITSMRLAITGGEFIGNTSASYAGCILAGLDTDITISGNTLFKDNGATTDGGAIYIYSSFKDNFTIGDTVIFENNTAGAGGGAIYTTVDNLPKLFIGAGVTFINNSASTGYKLRNPEDDAIYETNILATSWSEPYEQGFNNYDISYQGINPPSPPSSTCPVTTYRTVDVCLPVSIKPSATVGTIITRCCGDAIIVSGSNVCEGIPNATCDFTITQKVCIEVPVVFAANSIVGDAHVLCDDPRADGCQDCPGPE